MACSTLTEIGSSVEPPTISSNATTASIEVYVDVAELVDIPAEIKRKEKELEKLDDFIKNKTAKLSGDFVNKAPANVVEKERASLEDLRALRDTNMKTLERLRTVLNGKKS